MNERITELANLAIVERANGFREFDANVFAQLIVRECICQCDDENSQKYIMTHFGMKESDWS